MSIAIFFGLWLAVSALACFGMGKFIRAGARDRDDEREAA